MGKQRLKLGALGAAAGLAVVLAVVLVHTQPQDRHVDGEGELGEAELLGVRSGSVGARSLRMLSKQVKGDKGNGLKLRLKAVRSMILKAKRALDHKAKLELKSLEGEEKDERGRQEELVELHPSKQILKPELQPAHKLVRAAAESRIQQQAKKLEEGSQAKGEIGAKREQAVGSAPKLAAKAAKMEPKLQVPRAQVPAAVPSPEMNRRAEVEGKAQAVIPAKGKGPVMGMGKGEAKVQGDRKATGHSFDPMSKKELSNFVKSTIEQEKQVLGAPTPPKPAGGSGLKDGPEPTAGVNKGKLAHHYNYYDLHHHHHWWCQDNSNWHGPFGDPCVSYAVGGDRQFWCDWDGANAQNACPRSCGTCSHHQLKDTDEKREAENHFLQDHFDPQVGHKLPALQTSSNSKVVQEASAHATHKTVLAKKGFDGPHEPRVVAQDRNVNVQLLKEVEGMKKRLEMVAEATQDVAKQLKLSKENSKTYSSAEAADDLQSFFSDEETQTKSKHAKYVKRSLGKKHTSGWAISDLMSWFDSKGSKLKDETNKQTTARAVVEDHPILSPKKRKMSSSEAAQDIASYWSHAKKKLQVPQGKGEKKEGHLPKYTSADANHDLEDFLDKMVKGAQKAHSAETKLIKARQQKHGAQEAVSGKMTEKEAASALDDFWKKMPTEAVPTSKFGVQTPPEPEAMKEKFQAKKEAAKQDKSDSGEIKTSVKTNSELGLPSNSQEAVHVKGHKMTSKKAHESLDSYFSGLLNHAKSEDHYDQKTRAILAARARKVAIKRARARVARERTESIASLKQEARQQQLYLQEPNMYQVQQGLEQGQMPPLNRPPSLSPRQIQFNNAYNSFLASVDSQASNPNYQLPKPPKVHGWQSPSPWQGQGATSYVAMTPMAEAPVPEVASEAMTGGVSAYSAPGLASLQNQVVEQREAEAQKVLENIAKSNHL